jgi:hypothetical protein
VHHVGFTILIYYEARSTKRDLSDFWDDHRGNSNVNYGVYNITPGSLIDWLLRNVDSCRPNPASLLRKQYADFAVLVQK